MLVVCCGMIGAVSNASVKKAKIEERGKSIRVFIVGLFKLNKEDIVEIEDAEKNSDDDDTDNAEDEVGLLRRIFRGFFKWLKRRFLGSD